MISLFTHYSGLREYVGTDTDTPPFDVPNGSKFSRMDGKTYWFDGAHKKWISSDGDEIANVGGIGEAIDTPPREVGGRA